MSYSNKDSFFYHKSAFNAIYNAYTLKGGSTFTAWHKRAREAAEAVKQAKADYDNDLRKMEDIYSMKVVAEKRAEYQHDHLAMVEEAKERIMEDFDRVAEAKKAKLAKSLSAPSQDIVNLLSVLNMRTTITAGEIAAIVPQLSGNLQALKVLSEISNRNGINFPQLPTVERLNDDIEKIRDFACDMVNSIDSEWNYNQMLFWTTDFAGLIQQQIDALDDPSFLEIDTKEIEEEKSEHETQKKADRITKLTLNGTEYISTVARQFGTTVEAIQEANPNVDLIHFNAGTVITIPGVLRSPEDGNGHVNESSHKMEVLEA